MQFDKLMNRDDAYHLLKATLEQHATQRHCSMLLNTSCGICATARISAEADDTVQAVAKQRRASTETSGPKTETPMQCSQLALFCFTEVTPPGMPCKLSPPCPAD